MWLALAVSYVWAQAEGREVPLSPAEIPGGTLRAVETAKLYGNINKYGYYFVDLLIGSPIPQRTSVIVDTGSRIAGFPCRGCLHCGHHIDPAFDFNQSTSARWLECGADCKSGCVDGHCAYSETYAEGSSILGRWFDDQVELGDTEDDNPPVRAQLGCHSCEDKLFYTQRANGIMGLAPSFDGFDGSDAAPTVLQDLFRDKAHITTRIFSMCLASWGGALTVGGYNARYHEEQIQWTSMRASKYYFVFPVQLTLVTPQNGNSTIEDFGISVATRTSDFGVTIVDSGTTYTYLPGPLYGNIVHSLDTYCSQHNCGATREGSDCWRLQDASSYPDAFPVLRMRFQDEGVISWLPRGYLHERGEPGIWCQTFLENNLYQTVLGLSWMLHKDIIFDMEGSRLGIAKARCPENHRNEDFQSKYELAPFQIPPAQSLPWSILVGAMVLAAALTAFLWKKCPARAWRETAEASPLAQRDPLSADEAIDE